MAEQTIPRYGSVESYARILRRGKREFLESNALGIVQSIVDHPNDLDAVKVERVKNLLAAAWALDMEPADPTGLSYSRPADDPAPVSPARVPLHTGAVTDEGLVDESLGACPDCGHDIAQHDGEGCCLVCHCHPNCTHGAF